MDGASDVVAAGETLEVNEGLSQFTVVKLRRVDGLDYNPDSAPSVPETVAELAPLVHLHPVENYWPGDPLTFISNSSLNWFHEGGCTTDPVAPRNAVQASRLGAESGAPYTAQPDFRTINGVSCVPRPDFVFRAHNYTRPWDGTKRSKDNDFWNDPFYEREGFYLDQDDAESIRKGIEGDTQNPDYSGAPVFYEYSPGRYVTYWFFYPYNRFQTTSVVPDQAHEGDWERISIQLDSKDIPIRVFYYNHGDGDLYDWDAVQKEEGHVIVFSARGSHGSYPIASPDPFGFPTDAPEVLGHDHTGYGLKWKTWESLYDVIAQPWYGYGGAWGEVRAGYSIIASGEIFTGPLGPSRFKNSRDKWSPRITGRVTGVDGNGLAGVKISAFDAQGNVADEATTCAGNPRCGDVGDYSLQNLVFGKSYILVPTKTGYAFTPAAQPFTNLREPQKANFAVDDTIPPQLNLPANITVNANIPQGATVQYTVTATDNATPSPRVACSPQSGRLFPIGTTTVACTATDDAGNSANGTFKIIVKGAAAQLTDLTTLVKDFNLPNGTENSLVVKLQSALTEAKEGRACTASNKLKAFMNEVQAQSGKKISPAQANQMLAAADRIRTVMGC
jgi:hypothetical protein